MSHKLLNVITVLSTVIIICTRFSEAGEYEEHLGKTIRHDNIMAKDTHRQFGLEMMKWYRSAVQWHSSVNTWKDQAVKAIRNTIQDLEHEGEADSGEDVHNDPRSPDYDCDQIIVLKNGSSAEFYSPFFYSARNYPNQVKCVYRIFGDINCQPAISCSVFDIRKTSSECRKEYLKIHDGYGNSVKFCGKDGPRSNEVWKSPSGLRDIFVTFVTTNDEDGYFKDFIQYERDGFLCTAKCLKHQADVDEVDLPRRDIQFVEDRCLCGVGSQGRDDRIVGGQTALHDSYPWQAAVVEKGTRKPFCGCTLINDKFVLTASHCFPPGYDTSREKHLEVLIHAYTLEASQVDIINQKAKKGEPGWIKAPGWSDPAVTDDDEQTLRFAVKEIIKHPLFTHGKFDYDVALLRLAGRIQLTDPDSPVPVCLPPEGHYALPSSVIGTVVGWGLGDEKAAATTRLLQELTVPLLDMSKCRSWLPKNTITPRMLCAGYKDGLQDACRADSGGPLMRKVKDAFWEQIGIVSWGIGCARRKKPGFYSKISEMNQWIHHISNTRDARWCVRPDERRRG